MVNSLVPLALRLGTAWEKVHSNIPTGPLMRSSLAGGGALAPRRDDNPSRILQILAETFNWYERGERRLSLVFASILRMPEGLTPGFTANMLMTLKISQEPSEHMA